MTNEIKQQQGEIILYQPDETVRLEVRLEDDTVWLNRLQMAELFGRDVKTIGKHVNNALREELKDLSVIAKFATTASDGKTYQVDYYNLDMILSVGYRVKSSKGIQFRAWANQVLKQYLLRGYSLNERLSLIEQRVSATEKKIDFFVRTSLPPVVGVFHQGQVFSARLFVEDLVKTAKKEVILIDSYVDAKTFDLLDVRGTGVDATIYTERIDAGLLRLQQLHNQEHSTQPVNIAAFIHPFHDRFLIIDEYLWHCGASFKDLGRKLFAIDKLEFDKNIILNQL
ncbi:MAG: virulence RhuM family protein [Prevotella sp.]|nr:virulence RhuM family protein [Prevotella sp.]MBR6188271.1 virulence RhuM family protein [Prevotella sp.]